MKKPVSLIAAIVALSQGDLAFAERAKTVSIIDKYLDKSGEFNLALFQNVTVNDAANTGMGTGLSFGYYFSSWFGVGVDASYDWAFANMGEFNRLYHGKAGNAFRSPWTSVSLPLYTVSILSEWSPLYQKVNLFDLAVLRMYLTCYLGPTLVVTRQYFFFNQEDDVSSFGGLIGIGSEFILTKFLTAELRLSDTVYSEAATLVSPEKSGEYWTRYKAKNRVSTGISLRLYF